MNLEPDKIEAPVSSEANAAPPARQGEEVRNELPATFARFATTNELWNKAATWTCVGALAVVVVVVCLYEFAS